jgi:plasmid stabilization system protein ParE
MSYKHIYLPVAFVEYEEAVEWYKERSTQASENLVAEIEAGIKAICNAPLRYRNTYKNFREMLTVLFILSIKIPRQLL